MTQGEQTMDDIFFTYFWKQKLDLLFWLCSVASREPCCPEQAIIDKIMEEAAQVSVIWMGLT